MRSHSTTSLKKQISSNSLRCGLLLAALVLFATTVIAWAQHSEKPRPEAWNSLVHGGRFMDRILPAPIHQGLETDIWGADAVRPRDADNGIEDPAWSYWGGKPVLGSDGKYHFFVCRWREDNPKGHGGWPQSQIVHAVSNRPTGPFTVKKEIGPGHFPEITLHDDGSYAIYHFHGQYLAPSLDGPWTRADESSGFKDKTTFGSLTLREDGSLLMVDRILRIWLKEKGSDEFVKIREGVFPPGIKGRYEDPLIWRTEVQYHMIMNDWYGRTAYHFRSKNGVDWKLDPGEAYTTDFDGYEDGTRVGWYKYERPKILQDAHGRATHLYFAVIDVPKNQDKASDKHSSKNISLPLVVGRRLALLGDDPITPKTKTFRLRIKAENGFDPRKDVDVDSLRFGAPETVDFGGGGKALASEASGDDIVVTFDATGHAFTTRNFAGKLLGKTRKGGLLFGYTRLPGVDYSPYVIKK